MRHIFEYIWNSFYAHHHFQHFLSVEKKFYRLTVKGGLDYWSTFIDSLLTFRIAAYPVWLYSLSSNLPYSIYLNFPIPLTHPTLSWPTLPFLIVWYWLVLICDYMIIVATKSWLYDNIGTRWPCCNEPRERLISSGWTVVILGWLLFSRWF